MASSLISLVIPVYRNAENIAELLQALERLHGELGDDLEVVFVVDGSPDDSYLRLSASLPMAPFRSQLLLLSRNFGSFAAIRAGLAASQGEFFAVMAADLQEPPELIFQFAKLLREGKCDVAVGRRTGRADPLRSRMASALFWGFFRRCIQREIPTGGVDVFGCTRAVRDHLLRLSENNSSLVGLLFWVGFRRIEVPYMRQQRRAGRSGWTLRKKTRYLMDSIFSFSDLPIRGLLSLGLFGLCLSVLLAAVVAVAKIEGNIPVPGYAATVLVVTFFGALNCFGLGVIGGYVWRTFENTKGRPNYIVAIQERYGAAQPANLASDQKVLES
jgi:glycosyltransferase involved in cell wall biosynthesis